MQNLLKELTELLSKDERLVSEGRLLKNKIIEIALGMDADLIKLLLKNKSIKKHFFTEVGDVLVFDKIKFQRFVSNKEFLPDSYTAFKNKIGLVNERDDYLSDSKEVVLAWPYKDCVLQGGQTKEDQKRDEIFWNETLAPDEIDRLLAPKVFTDFKKYDKDGEHTLTGKEKIDFSKENIIIRGNNLLALHSLYKRFAGQVKLIYIDPPFNTGDDEFKYNDRFNHSTWMSFIKNRLEIAKLCLSKEGVICVHIGNEEASYIQVIMDEVFGRENYLNHISMTTNDPSGFKATSSKIFSTANHVFIYSRVSGIEKLNKIYVPKEYDYAYKYVLLNPNENYKKWKYTTIVDYIAKEGGFKNSTDFKKNVGSWELKEKIADFADKNKNVVFRTAAIGGGALAKRIDTVKNSKENRDIVFQHPNEDIEGFFILNGEQIIFWDNIYRKIDGEIVPSEALTDVWTDIGFTGIANEGGVKLKNGKKPEKLLKRIIELCTKKDDIVLDFFSGSGTTCAVAHKMGHQYIGIEQLDYDENGSVTRLQNVIKGDSTGISKAVNWQGGGSFIYGELMEWNEAYISRIHKAKTTNELIVIWDEMQKQVFISYKVDPESINQNISDFKELSLDEQKRFLIEVLDKNQLYVNYSEIDDADYKLSETGKKLNRMFYGEV